MAKKQKYYGFDKVMIVKSHPSFPNKEGIVIEYREFDNSYRIEFSDGNAYWFLPKYLRKCQ